MADSWLSTLAARVAAVPEIRAFAGRLLGAPSEAQNTRPLSQQLLYVGVQTPDDVASLMRLADVGYIYRLHDYWEEQRNRDCHLGSVVYRREHAISTLPWQVIPASEKRRDLKIAVWWEESLKRMGEIEHRESAERGVDLKSFSDLTVHLNGAVFPGFAASEVVYAKQEGYVVPAGAVPMNGRRFVFGTADGMLRWWDATGPAHPYPGKDLLRDYAAGRFILHRPRINGAAGPREGLWRPLLWASLFRTWAIGDWLKLAELAWKPYRLGYYAKNATGREDRNALEDALQKLIATGFAALPDSTKATIEYAKGNAQGEGQHAVLCAFLGQEMSKLALGHTLTVEEGNKGTARTAQTAESVAHGMLEIDARAEEGTLHTQFSTPLVRFNWGKVAVPRITFVTEQSADVELISTAVQKAQKAGLKGISAAWLRSILGAPEPTEGEEVLDGVLWKKPEETEDETDEPPDSEKPGGESEGETKDDGPEPDVPERAMKTALRNYYRHRVLCAAGMRRDL